MERYQAGQVADNSSSTSLYRQAVQPVVSHSASLFGFDLMSEKE